MQAGKENPVAQAQETVSKARLCRSDCPEGSDLLSMRFVPVTYSFHQNPVKKIPGCEALTGEIVDISGYHFAFELKMIMIGPSRKRSLAGIPDSADTQILFPFFVTMRP